ncbi:MAG: glycosyltransferase [Caldilineaceae bacterium]|nr:glycosyltransferase [Caldilineaceae bacterium]HRJ44184.1 glycosyltransferase [Caldilineaceae bacterium]
MQITVLTHNYPRFAGDFSGSFVQALCQEWMARGQRVDVLTPFDVAFDRPFSETQAGGSVHLHLFRYIWPTRWHRVGYGRSMQSDLRLRLNGYLLSPAFFAGGILAALGHCRRTRPDVIHAHWALPNGFIGAVVSRLTGIPLVVSIPGSDAQVANSNPLFRRMARFTFAQASLITANSGALRDAVLPLGADPAKFEMIVYGVDPARLRPDPTGTAELRAQLGVAESDVMLLAVGRMVAKKGFDVLLRALAGPELSQRPTVAVMIGRGDEWESWQRLAESLGVGERVRWVGIVPFDQISRYYNACDLLVMPSVTAPADGLNVCVPDAMSCGKPVVGSNAAGNDLAIVDGETGFVVPEGDASALAQAIALLADDGMLRQQMGAAGRRRVESHLGWPVLAQGYLDHFRRIVGE